jgi:hypothetical protein
VIMRTKSNNVVATFGVASTGRRIFGGPSSGINDLAFGLLDDVPSGIMIPTLFSGFPAIYTTRNEYS